jgi:peroxiredoxin
MPTFKNFQGDPEHFPFAMVEDGQGRKIPMSRFWQNQTAILVFLRHFGCISCRSHSQDVWANRAKLEQKNAKIIFIGNGHASKIPEFRQTYHLDDAPLFTDPSLKVFDLAGFNHGLAYLAKPQSLKNMLSLAKEGHSNGSPFAAGTGSNRQLGGIIVVHPGFRVAYQYISEALGDTPTAGDMANDNICELPAERSEK